jgi:hypothetical protein
MIARDGKAAICARIESPRRSGDAGWLHNLEKPLPPVPDIPPRPSMVRAAPEVLNTVYSAFLTLSNLSAAHRDNLKGRGLTDIDINQLGYKSMPGSSRWSIVNQLLRMGYRLAGVPGFYFDKQWRLNGASGILIPARDEKYCIKGFQIRRDKADDKPKYVWLSSCTDTWKPKGGSSPGSPLHIATPFGYQYKQGDDIWITEGILKADIASRYLNCMVLAVPGVGILSPAITFLQNLPDKPARVVLAFDMDKEKNDQVHLHLSRLTERLLRLGIKIGEADWDSSTKGIDDFYARTR